MTTSGSYDFNYNRDQIIRAAGRKVGAFQSGEIPDAQTVQDFSDALNMLVKSWEGQGIHIWTETEATLFLQPGQLQYSLGPGSADNATVSYVATTIAVNANIGQSVITVASTAGMVVGDFIGLVLDKGTTQWTKLTVIAGNNVTILNPLTDTSAAGNAVYDYTTKIQRPLRIPFGRRYNFLSAIDTPLFLYSRKDYRDLPNKTSTGTPTVFFYDAQLVQGQFFIWPVPTAPTDAIKFTWYRPIQDFDTSGDTPDLPQEWLSALVFNLAVEMAPEYGMPAEQFGYLAQQAIAKLENMYGWDREYEPTNFGIAFDQMGPR